MTGTLSVRENIMFSASLQLPSDTTKEDKAEVVDGVVKDLGLSHVADTWVSDVLCLHIHVCVL